MISYFEIEEFSISNNLIDHNKSLYFTINTLYSYKNEVNCMNVRWMVGRKARNPDLVIPKFGVALNLKFVGIT